MIFLCSNECFNFCNEGTFSTSNEGHCQYCKYYSQGMIVFLVSNTHVDSKLLTKKEKKKDYNVNSIYDEIKIN